MVYSEPELIIPGLRHLKNNPNGLTTTELSRLLRVELKPIGEDLVILARRKDDKFSQKVRNVTGSHRSLERKGFVTYDAQTGIHKITKDGVKHLEDNEPIFDFLNVSGFDKNKIQKALKKDYTDIILDDLINEGQVSNRTIKHRQRSSKLRKEKIKELKRVYGKVSCLTCEFDFSVTYDGHGKNYIEIHHLEPVHLMDIQGNQQKLRDALKKVIPLCSNCHRMMHRKPNHILTVDELKKLIEDNRQSA